MKKKIYPKEWREFHPNNMADKTDIYYTSVANDIYTLAYDFNFHKNVFEEDAPVRKLALLLTALFEDIISEIGVWKAFTAECKKRYGVYLPFYELEDYQVGDINEDDVKFFIWHYIQQTENREGIIINPENVGIDLFSLAVYALFRLEYETAPESETYKDYVDNIVFDSSNIYKYRSLLSWFNNHCFINFTNLERLKEAIDEFVEENEDCGPEYIKTMAYGLEIEMLFSGEDKLFGYASHEWLAKVFSNHAQHKLLEDVKHKSCDTYLFVSEDDSNLYVEDLLDGKLYTVTKKSIVNSLKNNYSPRETILVCSLVYFGGVWWCSGALSFGKYSKSVADKKQEEKMIAENCQLLYDKFMKATAKKNLKFFENYSELENFMNSKIVDAIPEEADVPHEFKDNSLLVYVTPERGMMIFTHGIHALKSKLNKSYKKDEACVLAFIADKYLIDYDILCYLIQKGMLKDAALTSLHGKRHGKAFLQKNIQFFADYFHNR
ncbi:MAG: DUF3843 family protein [Rikenellaceae bacterium]